MYDIPPKQGLYFTMKKLKPHYWRKRATSRIHQHTMNYINLCYTREQAVNSQILSSVFHWKRQHTANGMLRLNKWAEHWLKGIILVKACYVCCMCNKFSEESVSLSSAADFVPQYKDFYCNISYRPPPSLAHPVPEVPKFTAVRVSLWFLRNLICRVWPQYFISLQDFESHMFNEPLIWMSKITSSLHLTIWNQGRVRSGTQWILREGI